jgi:hypothetical protein
MKRDMDFIRELLLKIEGGEKEFDVVGKAFTGGIDPPEMEKLTEHIRLLRQAGFIDVEAESLGGHLVLTGLSWRGHDFLDSVRDPKIWEKTKSGAAAAGGFTVDLLIDLAKGFLKKQIEERTGVKI